MNAFVSLAVNELSPHVTVQFWLRMQKENVYIKGRLQIMKWNIFNLGD